jgi:hypothetical protein
VTLAWLVDFSGGDVLATADVDKSLPAYVRAAVLAYGGTDGVKLADRLWAVPLATLLG